MSQKQTKNPRITTKQRRIKKKALEMIKDDPSLSDWSINQRLVEEGITREPNYLYRKVGQRELIRRDLAQVRKAHEEQLAYDMVPRAFDNTKKVFKNKDIPEEKKFPYTKLVFDKFFGEQERHYVPTQVNIGQIQAIIMQSLNKEFEDIE